MRTFHGRGYQFVADLIEDNVECESSEAATLNSTKQLPLPDKPSIAVLPFINVNGDPEQEYLSDGTTEDITTALSYFSGLFVIARNSSFAYKGQSIEPKQIARELGVRYLLSGSLRRSGSLIRIRAELTNALADEQLWAQNFDGDLSDVFALQDEITGKIVSSIAPEIERAELERSRGIQLTDLSSYETALKARSQAYDAYRQGDAGKMQAAIERANEALQLDARNTHALSLLGITQIDQYLYRWGDNPTDVLAQAARAVEDLIRVDPNNGDGYTMRGCIKACRRQFDEALLDLAGCVVKS